MLTTKTPSVQDIIDEWKAVSRYTDRIDRPKFEEAIKEVYRATPLPPPGPVIYARSPIEAVILASICQQDINLGDLKDRKPDVLQRILTGAIEFPPCGYGQFDLPIMAFLNIILVLIKKEAAHKVRETVGPLINLSKLANFWWPFDHVVIASERPAYIGIDDTGIEPAATFSDNWAVVYFDGNPVEQTSYTIDWEYIFQQTSTIWKLVGDTPSEPTTESPSARSSEFMSNEVLQIMKARSQFQGEQQVAEQIERAVRQDIERLASQALLIN